MIYDYHFAGYEIMLYKHSQPPLTLASSQLRSEILPVFYKCVKFSWNLHSTKLSGKKKPRFSDTSRELLMMPAACLSRIRTFSIYWTTLRSAGLRRGQRILQVLIQAHQNQEKGVSGLVRRSRPKPWIDQVRDTIGYTAREIGYYSDDWKLQHEHLHTFRRMVNLVLRS